MSSNSKSMTKSLSCLIISLFLLAGCRISAQTCNTEVCPVVGGPYVENNCFAGIKRYLARSMAMDGLTRVNTSAHNWPSECMSADYSCNASYEACPFGGFCPQRYCDDISLLIDLNIAFVRRAAGLWTSEHLMKVDGPYYTASQQTIIDINRAYDCAGLRQPIIQAAILENITMDINKVPIPQYVVDAFSNDLDFDSLRYSGSNLFFNSCHLVKEGCIGYPDLNKVEARMWYYYLATKYIDFGYKALHMGQIKIIAEFDAGNTKTYNLFQSIRNYASNKRSFVIIDAHTTQDIFLEQTNKLLLDFNSSPTRPTDTYDNLLGASCSEDLKTMITGSEGIYGKSKGGVSPLGCYYEQTPYFVELDHYDPYPGNAGQFYPEEYIVWGYDEQNYFYNLSSGCKSDFVKYAYFRLREIDYNGFFQFPGRNGVGSWEIPGDKTIFRLYDDLSLKSEIKNILSPSLDIDIAYNYSEEVEILNCGEVTFRDYVFNIKNTDVSSCFTWHIKKPDGKWEDYTHGQSRTYRPLEGGTYTVYLRQDNLALPSTVFGTKTISVEFDIPSFDEQCVLGSNGTLTETEDFQKEQPIVYPNPTSNMLNVDMKDFSDESANIVFVDMLGRVIFTELIEKETQIYSKPLNGIASGIYNVIIEQNGDVLSYKVVVENSF